MTDFDLLDVLSGRDDSETAFLQRRKAYQARRAVCPDGRKLEANQTWCGRCGSRISTCDLVINHDLGYAGCPVEVDPVWSKMPPREDGLGWRGASRKGQGSVPMSVAQLCNRWDRQYFRDCKCGHPWGLHEDNSDCHAYCGCVEYREKRKYTRKRGNQ